MEITEVKIYPFKGSGNTKAYVRVIIDDSLVLSEITIVHGKFGFFISFPEKECTDGKRRDIFYPITKETRQYFSDTILKEWEKIGG